MKIKTSVQVELFENDARECNQVLYIRPHKDNETYWSELAVQDTDPGHFDADPKPRTKIIFDNVNLDDIIKALIIYKDNLKTINNK
jgi:hypothetical protein